MSTSNPQQPNDTHDIPPSYEQAIGSTSSSASPNTSASQQSSVQDANRPLPKGWVRQWDPTSQNAFYVDTQTDPPRSIWVHPLDDPQFQTEHPESIQYERKIVEKQHMVEQDTDDEDESQVASSSKSGSTKGKASNSQKPKGKKTFGRSLKDKLTGTTHEERVVYRRQQAEEEARMRQQDQKIHNALVQAAQTGQPQFIGRDQHGRELFAQPALRGRYGGGPTLGFSPYPTIGQDPFSMYGPYSAPTDPFMRRGGMGMGLPIAAGMAGGLLLGGLLF